MSNLSEDSNKKVKFGRGFTKNVKSNLAEDSHEISNIIWFLKKVTNLENVAHCRF